MQGAATGKGASFRSSPDACCIAVPTRAAHQAAPKESKEGETKDEIGQPDVLETYQMSSTETAEMYPFQFAKLKLLS
jgi:hypothetical protein